MSQKKKTFINLYNFKPNRFKLKTKVLVNNAFGNQQYMADAISNLIENQKPANTMQWEL